MQFLIYLATGERRQNTLQIFLQGKLLRRALVLTLWCAESHGNSSGNIDAQAPNQPTSTQSEYLGTIKLVGWWMVNNKSQGLQSGGSYHRNARGVLLEGKSWASEGSWGSETEVTKVSMCVSCKIARCFYVTRGSKKRSVDMKSSFAQKNKHFMISKTEQT